MIVIRYVLVLANATQKKATKTKNYQNSLRLTTQQYWIDYAVKQDHMAAYYEQHDQYKYFYQI